MIRVSSEAERRPEPFSSMTAVDTHHPLPPLPPSAGSHRSDTRLARGVHFQSSLRGTAQPDITRTITSSLFPALRATKTDGVHLHSVVLPSLLADSMERIARTGGKWYHHLGDEYPTVDHRQPSIPLSPLHTSSDLHLS
jgi:hypothetical protein